MRKLITFLLRLWVFECYIFVLPQINENKMSTFNLFLQMISQSKNQHIGKYSLFLCPVDKCLEIELLKSRLILFSATCFFKKISWLLSPKQSVCWLFGLPFNGLKHIIKEINMYQPSCYYAIYDHDLLLFGYISVILLLFCVRGSYFKLKQYRGADKASNDSIFDSFHFVPFFGCN